MSNLNEIITFNLENAYDFVYYLSMKKNYSNPKIYTPGGDLNKRRKFIFLIKISKTAKMKRVTPFYGNAQKYKTKEERLFVLSPYKQKILELLKKDIVKLHFNTRITK